MLHGNLLLHHWWVSDVSFYTTELPQYALIEALLGLGPWVVHVGAAMTYTLLVLLAALLAKGRAQGGEGLARALLAAGLMLAPQLSATSVLLLSPDHTGTGVPLLVIWLLIDRTDGSRPRWFVPVLVGLAFAWTMVADSVILLTGIVPLVLVCAVRACPGLIRGGERPAPRWYELSLAGGAAVAGVLGSYAPHVIAAVGGYQEWHVGTDADFSQLQHGSWVTFQAFLELFGANIFGTSNFGTTHTIEILFVALHLAGAIVVICALGVAARRFFRFGDLIVPVFAVAVVVNLVAYLISPHARNLLGAREIAGVLPLGAVLAGRTLGGALLTSRRQANQQPAHENPPRRATRRLVLPVLAVLTAGYLGSFAYGGSQAAVPASNQSLATWLTAHRLTDGLATYWQANSSTVDSHGAVLVSAVKLGAHGRLIPYQWETNDADYNPSRHYANFVVAEGISALPGMQAAAILTFGPPLHTYHANGYLIMTWNKNLLTKLN
jgi:hypothetical protein